MPKNSTLRFVRIAGTTALLVYVVHKAGLFSADGRRDLLDTFVHVKPPFLLASIGFGLLLNLSSAFKWYMLSRSRGLPVNLWRLFAYYMVGQFFNLVLPSSIGGDVVRMHQLGRYTGRYADAVASVFVERFTGLATLVLLAMVAVVVNLHLFNLPWLTIGLAMGSIGIALICWLIIDQRPFRLTQKLLARRVPLLQKLFVKIEKFRQAVLAYQSDPGAIWGALINSLIFYFLAVMNVWVSALAFGSKIDFVSMLVAVPVILFIMNLPISIGGIGLMEFAYSFTLGLVGATPALAFSTALLLRAKTLFHAGIGSLLYPFVSDGHPIREGVPMEVTNKYGENGDD
ncbi:lysylphosphatidylglycerol synthase transmembrane domain-containing protein [Moorena sp. SIO3I6]|uniref:lysylphosphatidylglycerol synthase transmembrane domain-containing protein n=1 Tax=Moorena sp. SIO3I6 TaxID=2607831 RepID=UPI0013F8D7D7|nr:lysylphosphatidylglycerol synthase transmembrane domain-containing protein [Moorena sp. SIO3I6]NEP23226.1 flippase-like domain-containing protein [Moorena sp. SIO3I6]